MKKRIFSLILASLMVTTAFAACQSDEGGTTDGGDTTSSTATDDGGDDEGGGDVETGDVVAGPADTSEHYEFTRYANYTWWTIREWGADEASKFMQDKFNITMIQEKPDSDANAKLNLMISGGTLPDAVAMDRNADYIKLAQLGQLLPIDQFMYEGNHYQEMITPTTQEFLKVDGATYAIPHWARNTGTGGNLSWIVNERVWEEAGSPELDTLEGIEAYMAAVKDLNTTTYLGDTVQAFLTQESADGRLVAESVYRSLGAAPHVNNWYSQDTGEIIFMPEDPKYVEALKKVNEWFNLGYFNETIFTDSSDQFKEKASAGKAGIMYYDFSQNDVNNFKNILEESTGGEDTYFVLTDPIFPPAEGVEKVYGEENQTPGGALTAITTNAEEPQRIFDLMSWMLSKEGAINMMYGPQGTGMWDELDADGNPILRQPESSFTAEEKQAMGAWYWASPAHADPVDYTKFAVNAQQPEEDQSWVVTLQANVFTQNAGGEYKDGQKFTTDENTGVPETIDPQSDLGINRQMIADKCAELIPQIIMAGSEADFQAKLDELIQFAKDYGVDEITSTYNEKRNENIEVQGWSFYE